MRCVKAICFVLLVFCLSACGTVNTVFRDESVPVHQLEKLETYCDSIPRVYSGVVYDVCKLHAKPVRVHDEGISEIDNIKAVPISFLDMLICVGTDTLVLPYTLVQQNKNGNIIIE